MRIHFGPLGGALALSLALTGCGLVGAADLTIDDLGTLDVDGFTMAFPEDYETQDQSALGMNFTLYVAEADDGDAFAASLIEVPQGQGISLEGALQGGAANANGTVEDSRATTVDDFAALEGRFAVEQEGETGTGWAVFADVDGSLFQFIYIVSGQDDATDPPAIFDDIVASIDIE